MSDETIIRVTTAPEAYDGFGTETLETLGTFPDRHGYRDRVYRKVSILPEHEDWQTMRYGSGMYACISESEFAEWVRLGLT